MRILFVSGTSTGGATISTRALADRLAARGHTVGILCRSRRNDVGLGSTAPLAIIRATTARARRMVERIVVRRPSPSVTSTHGPLWTTRHLETVASLVFAEFGPDVVVVNSVHARAWAVLRREAHTRRTPIVLYVREHNAVGHIARGESADLVITNAHSHASAAARLGIEAVVVPSIVDTAQARVETSRSTVLYINPIPSRGLSTAIAIARLRPDLQFVFQESHRLYRGDRRMLARLLRGIDNVTVRPYSEDQAHIYRDAAVLLVPYQVENRPRVVLEAHANGIPVVAADLPGLDECVGEDGGVLVPAGAPPSVWADALGHVLDDVDRYREFVKSARRHAQRDEVDPALLTEQFEAAVETLVNSQLNV
jgi:glycosyltransferase involved in cell wall biosynthesis